MGMVYDAKRFALVAQARRFVGVKEATGHNDGPIIEEFQRAVGGRAEGQPYCMDFVQYCAQRVDLRYPGHHRWLFPSQSTLQVFNLTTLQARIQPQAARIGDIVIWQFWRHGTEPTNEGHCGVVVNINSALTFSTVEANTSPGNGIDREGDGVYQRVRNFAGSDTMRIKGFLRCWDPNN